MRLGCPNCDAQYEVDDAAIPAAGRDVQCSNCGHTWFQLPAGAAAVTPAPPRARPAPPPAAAVTAPGIRAAPPVAAAAGPAPVAPAVPTAVAAPAPAVPQRATPQGPAGPDDPAPAQPPQQRRTLDDNLMAILREEAAREVAERKSEAERSLQVQPELGVPDAPRKTPVKPAGNRFADLSSPEPDAPGDPEAPRTRPPSRKALLPDIEEINSTLRPGADQRGGADIPAFTEAAERRRGFGAGFLSVLLVAAALTLVYVLAPRLAEALPQAKGVIDQYVVAVDAARLWLDDALQRATGALRGLSGETQAPPG